MAELPIVRLPPDPRLASRPDAGRWERRFDSPSHTYGPFSLRGEALGGAQKIALGGARD